MTDEHPYSVFCDDSQTETHQLKRVCIIVNPNSGGRKGLKVLERVKPILEEGGCTVKVLETKYAGHAKVLANEEDLSEIDVFAPIGGDGTVHEVVNGFMSRKDYDKVKDSVTICIFPAGTGNTVAYDLKIGSPEKAAEIVLKGTTRRIDVGVFDKSSSPQGGSAAIVSASDVKLEDESKEESFTQPTSAPDGRLYWINICGYALPTTVLKLANRLRFLGGAQYDLAAKQALFRNKGYKCKIEMIDAQDNEIVLEGKYSMVQAQITVHMGDRMAFTPHAKLDDGLMDLVLIEHRRVGKMISTMLAAQKNNGSHLEKKNVKSYQIKQLKVTPIAKNKMRGESSVNLDGELVGFSPFVASVAQKALRVVAE